jgi:glycosyltransferase involved in cell wall biosynthesis
VRALLLNQFYPPDAAPTGRVLHDLARVLVGRGHDVDVICSRRSYDGHAQYPAREVRDGVRVRRLGGLGGNTRRLGTRLAGYGSFQASLLVELMRRRWSSDVVMALTTPPYLGLGAVLAAWYGARHVHWVMDVYPDVIAADGALRRDGIIYRGLEAFTRLQFRRATFVLGLGPFMANRLKAYVPDGSRLRWVPLWGAEGPEPAGSMEARRTRAARGWGESDLVLMYSGNMGRGHRFVDFLETARRFGGSGPVWVFVGTGTRRKEVESFAVNHPAARLQLLPLVGAGELRASLCAADVHLIGMQTGWEGLIAPSKLQTAFAVGRPVLFVGPGDSEISRWIQESGGGWTVSEGDVGGILAAIEAARNPSERARRGAAALAFAREHFDRQRNCDRIAELLEEAARRPKS